MTHMDGLVRAAQDVLNYAGMDRFLDDKKVPAGMVFGITKKDLDGLRTALTAISRATNPKGNDNG